MSVEPPAQQHTVHQRTVAHRLFEFCGVVAFFVLVVVLVVRNVGVVANRPLLALPSLAGVMLGYLLADFASGLVHFTFDRFFTTQTPILGGAFVTAFRQHHSDPIDITRHGFIATNGNNSLATTPLLLLLVFLPLDQSSIGTVLVTSTLVWSAIATFGTNQFHKWAHQADVSPLVAWLQRRHLILPKDHHQLHHTFPYDSHYCITTGWLNGLLVGIGFWTKLEFILARIVRLPHFVETTPWEQIPGSPAALDRQQMLRPASADTPVPTPSTT
jgi:hypothetical protein